MDEEHHVEFLTGRGFRRSGFGDDGLHPFADATHFVRRPGNRVLVRDLQTGGTADFATEFVAA